MLESSWYCAPAESGAFRVKYMPKAKAKAKASRSGQAVASQKAYVCIPVLGVAHLTWRSTQVQTEAASA